MAIVRRYIEVLTVRVLFLWRHDILRGGRCMCVCCRGSASCCSEHTSNDHSWGYLPQPSRGWNVEGKESENGEDTVTSEEEDAESQDFNIAMYHGHLARNCLMKIITPAVKALVICSVSNQKRNDAEYSSTLIAWLQKIQNEKFSFQNPNNCPSPWTKYSEFQDFFAFHLAVSKGKH